MPPPVSTTLAPNEAAKMLAGMLTTMLSSTTARSRRQKSA